VSESTGDWKNASFTALADDAVAGADFLKTRADLSAPHQTWLIYVYSNLLTKRFRFRTSLLEPHGTVVGTTETWGSYDAVILASCGDVRSLGGLLSCRCEPGQANLGRPGDL
jgi:hypothetical protein